MALVILEPIVTFVLAALALLGLLTTLFFHLVARSSFPVWTMFALSLGFAIALVPYHALIRMLSDSSNPTKPRNVIGGQ
jgi:protein-S-isoprenylcysteine O-methyltransferase Ste14